ncbi:nitrate- and nitrite sensing domain-containing protein [Streptomyces coeruleoprunus]|uniref:histidine kinase n=1 Tax=Streptomyces coeruleoprunus TaxID=285563 RepID=A0ABV9XKD3_9ACTN
MQKRSDTPGDPNVPGGRSVRVRSRLVTGVALVGITVIGAGAPALLSGSAELSDSQRLVTLAELNRQAVTLAHSLADERDEVTAYIAAGRGRATADGQDGQDGRNEQDGQGGQDGAAKNPPSVPGTYSARVDRQIEEIHAEAPEDLRRDLAAVPGIRRAALTGTGSAMEAYRAYTDVIVRLQALAAELADKTPARAADGSGRATAELGQAVEQASATRGLLLAALALPGEKEPRTVYDPVSGRYVTEKDAASEATARTRDELSAAAQQARVQERAALADFARAADPSTRESLAATVSGPEVKAAEEFLGRLTDRPELSEDERRTDPEKLKAALTARVEQMRGVESALATGQVERMEQLRDDDVTALELRVALLGGCLLIAIGVSTAVARTLTRPLAVLRLGAARVAAAPETEEPIRFTGRNDEFAQVVRSLNTLHDKLRALGSRAGALDGERADLDGAREAMAAELEAHRAELREETDRLTAELRRLRHTVHHTFVNLSLRTLGLVERQLTVIEKLEEREQDPERLATLFKLDHMATVMRRHSENLLILAGHEHSHAHQGPVPLVDVLRAAVSEIERYERVTIQSLPPHAHVAGFAADDLSHLLAELLENATSFSPPDAQVQLSGWLLESGEVMLSAQDKGIGITPARLAELNARLAEGAAPDAADIDDEGEGLGLRVAALLAARHGVRVELRQEKQGGVAAVVVLPQSLLPEAPPTAGPPSAALADGARALSLPGSVAEANSNTLPGRTREVPPAPATADGGAAPADEAPEASGAEAREPEDTAAAAADADEATVDADEALEGDTEEAEASEAGPDEADAADADALVADSDGPDAPEADVSEADVSEADVSEPDALEDEAFEDEALGSDVLPDDDAPEVPEPASDDAPADIDPAHGRTDDATVAESAPVVEETLQVRLPLPPESGDGADAHDRPAEPKWERVTDKGLPKRTPQAVETGTAPAERTGGIDAAELRRRLGGFQQGARNGRRDAEAEIARTEDTPRTTGDTVEEAHS